MHVLNVYIYIYISIYVPPEIPGKKVAIVAVGGASASGIKGGCLHARAIVKTWDHSRWGSGGK